MKHCTLCYDSHITKCLFSRLKVLAHRVRNSHLKFSHVKKIYDCDMMCKSRLHTASETFVHHKKKSYRVDFTAFFASVASILRGVLTIKVELSFLSKQSQDWMDPIFLFLFLRRERTTKSSSLLEDSILYFFFLATV